MRLQGSERQMPKKEKRTANLAGIALRGVSQLAGWPVRYRGIVRESSLSGL